MGKTIKKKSSKTRTNKEKKKNLRIASAIILTICVVSLIGALILFAIAPGEEEEAPLSTLTLKCQTSGEDVSWVNIETYTPTDAAVIESFSDLFIDSNWELSQEGAANTLTFNLTLYPYGFWIHIDDSTNYYESTWFHHSGSDDQYNITIFIAHNPSNVFFNNLNKSDLSATIPSNLTSETYKMVTAFPYDSEDELHVGNDFETSLATYALDQAYYQNQANFRILSPAYELDVDTDNNFDTAEGVMTNTFSFRFTANDTISLIDGNLMQINITIATTSWDYQIIDDEIYIYTTISLGAGFTLEYTMSVGEEITIDKIDSGIATLPALVINSYDVLSTITV